MSAGEIHIIKTGLNDILHLRTLFLHENNFQFVHNKCHDYGWADNYLFLSNKEKIGYGSVWGKDKREDRDTIFEFYLLPYYQSLNNRVFLQFSKLSGARFIQCQSNDRHTSPLFYQHGHNVNAEAILFEDRFQTNFSMPGIFFERKKEEAGHHKADLPYFLQLDGITVATGGLMLNYNMPYADLYYEVFEKYRCKGLGSIMAQELKKEAYRIGKVPSARCNINNEASQALLLKSGFAICGHLLVAEIIT